MMGVNRALVPLVRRLDRFGADPAHQDRHFGVFSDFAAGDTTVGSGPTSEIFCKVVRPPMRKPQSLSS